MGIALRHEERRRGYVSDQTQLMTSTHDDGLQNSQEAFGIILETSSLAKNIKKMYEDLCGNGEIGRIYNIYSFLIIVFETHRKTV